MLRLSNVQTKVFIAALKKPSVEFGSSALAKIGAEETDGRLA